MKVAMSRITIYGNKKDRKAVLEYLQRRQCVDISEPDPAGAELGFTNMNTSDSQAEFLRERALSIPGKLAACVDLAPEKAKALYEILYEIMGRLNAQVSH